MLIRKFTFAAMLTAAVATIPTFAYARTHVDVVIAPPAPIVETVPAPRTGYVWAPGYWSWNGHRYVWVTGHWMHHRPGHRWVAHNWERHGDRWRFHEGYWDRNR